MAAVAGGHAFKHHKKAAKQKHDKLKKRAAARTRARRLIESVWGQLSAPIQESRFRGALISASGHMHRGKTAAILRRLAEKQTPGRRPSCGPFSTRQEI